MEDDEVMRSVAVCVVVVVVFAVIGVAAAVYFSLRN